jgi:methylated-DNA-[protein]-cysteine S-methyltransferase
MTLLAATLPTPWAPLSIIVEQSDQPVVLAAAFSSIAELTAKAGLPTSELRQSKALDGVASTVTAYVDGQHDAFDTLAVRQPGGPFMQDCWQALRRVPAGTVVSYAELASAAGRPTAVRAAGTACSSNLIAPIIPCHRVVRSGGELGNYGFGVPLKLALLKFEGARTSG